jgi:hypothetical protein
MSPFLRLNIFYSKNLVSYKNYQLSTYKLLNFISLLKLEVLN